MKILISLVLLIGAGIVQASGINVGHRPPIVELAGDAGGRVDGKPWSSRELTGVVHILMYVDPDEVKTNEHVEKALKDASFPEEKFISIAMINLAASWKPKFVIDQVLKKKQKQYPKTIYVRDVNKLLVSAWGLRDQDYHVVAFDLEGKVLFSKGGSLSADEVDTLLETIRSNFSP